MATNRHSEINTQGYTWIAIVSGVILTTMQVQDLKDQAGDRERGRRTIPRTLGDVFSRRMIASCVVGCSLFCPFFWRLRAMGGRFDRPSGKPRRFQGVVVAWSS